MTGTQTDDGNGMRVTALENGHFVVTSPYWSNGATPRVGAATWVDGNTGAIGPISASNSLIGPDTDKGPNYTIALSNGHYVVSSSSWDAGDAFALGAVTWANGTTGLFGVVSSANSLVGATAEDGVGVNVVALSNGNYVVGSPYWDGALPNMGAVTLVDGNSSIVGTVSAANSLVGSSSYDFIGWIITPLSNGNYVVSSETWDGPGAVDGGAVTWGNGTSGVIGTVSAANSLIGASPYDHVGGNEVTALSNGNYVVCSQSVDLAGHADAGAATWVNGNTGAAGTVSTSNSLYGSANTDLVCSGGAYAMADGNYVVSSGIWNNRYGAITLGTGTAPLVGSIKPSNSVRGTSSNSMVFDYDAVRHRLVVGRQGSNIVSLFTLDADKVFADGFEP